MASLRSLSLRSSGGDAKTRRVAHLSQSLSAELDKLMFVVVGARDFSPEITVLPIGTEVPCSDRVLPQILIYRVEGGFFQNVVGVSISNEILGICAREWA